MPDQKLEAKPRPYAAQGARLRARKEQLIRDGRLPNDLKEIAKRAGVTVSGLGQWERGETWPKQSRRAAVAAVFAWTAQELDHDTPQVSVSTEGSPEMASHPVSPDEMELLALYRGLEDQTLKAEVRHEAAARLHARHALRQGLRSPLKPASDAEVVAKMPVTDPEKKKKLPGGGKKKPAQ